MRLSIPAEQLERLAATGIAVKVSPAEVNRALEYRGRIANSGNPVEFVNDMYGCHPEGDKTYFEAVFSA